MACVNINDIASLLVFFTIVCSILRSLGKFSGTCKDDSMAGRGCVVKYTSSLAYARIEKKNTHTFKMNVIDEITINIIYIEDNIDD